MREIDLRPDSYRDLRHERPRYSLTEFLSFWIASRWATQRRDEDFETRQINAIAFGVGTYFMRKFMG